MNTICGADFCEKCPNLASCGGCEACGGKPYGGSCMLAVCAQGKGGVCQGCGGNCALKKKLMDEINALAIPGMPKVEKLAELPGAYINLVYPLPSGKSFQIWDEKRIYLGAQLEGAGNGRCFGVVADESMIAVCTYGENGADPELLLLKKRNLHEAD